MINADTTIPNWPRWSAVLLILLALIATGRSLSADFTSWDDPSTVSHNPDLNPPTLTSIARYWTQSHMSLYVPMTYTTWGAIAKAAHVKTQDETGSQLNPALFHGANVLLHVAATLLVWRVLCLLPVTPAGAVLGAAIFAVHPVQMEAVAWVSGLKDVQSAALSLAAMVLYLRASRVDVQPRSRSVVLYVFAIVCFILAMLSKPSAMVVPAMLLVIDVLARNHDWRQSILRLWPWFALSAVCAVRTALVQPPIDRDVTPLLWRPIVALDAVGFYVMKLLWPVSLGIDYGRTPSRVIDGWMFVWPAVIALVVVLFTLMLTQSRRGRVMAAGVMVFLLGIAPVLGLVPFTFQAFSTVADHYLYLSMLGVAMIVSGIVSIQRSRVTLIIGWTIVAIFAVLSVRQSGFWRDSATLFAHTLTVNPKSASAHTNWAADLISRRGDENEIITHLRTAIRIDPADKFAHQMLASRLLAQRNGAEAAEHFRELVRLYALQRNFDPKLGEATIRAIAQSLRNAGFATEAKALESDAPRLLRGER